MSNDDLRLTSRAFFMQEKDLLDRTKKFALRVLNLSRAIPCDREGNVIAKQVVRSGTSVAANYRAACRSRSKSEFISKLSIVEEETDETIFWMELLIESGSIKPVLLASLMKEADEILAIVVSSKITAKASLRDSQIDNRKSKISEPG